MGFDAAVYLVIKLSLRNLLEQWEKDTSPIIEEILFNGGKIDDDKDVRKQQTMHRLLDEWLESGENKEGLLQRLTPMLDEYILYHNEEDAPIIGTSRPFGLNRDGSRNVSSAVFDIDALAEKRTQLHRQFHPLTHFEVVFMLDQSGG